MSKEPGTSTTFLKVNGHPIDMNGSFLEIV
jgi:hypothetical protein